jgi:hypothetical protein
VPKESPSHRSNGIFLQALPRIRRLVDVAACSAPLSYKTGPLWYGACYTYIHAYTRTCMVVQDAKQQGRALHSKLCYL